MAFFLRLAVSSLLLFTISAHAQGRELEGLWQEFDDDTGNIVALIRIEKTPDNTYEGKIEKLFPESQEKSALFCDQCLGTLHHSPLMGLRILTGMKRKDGHNYDGGEILDPDDGKTYRCHIHLSDDGNKIEVTGYINLNWIGQSEVWRRAK